MEPSIDLGALDGTRPLPSRALQSLPRLETDFDERRVRRIVWPAFGALLVVVAVLVAWWLDR